MKLELSIPPSVNNIYRRSRYGVYMTPKGKAWFEESIYEARIQLDSWTTITSDVAVKIEMFTCRSRDVDNVGKASLDLIAKHLQLIENDSQVTYLRIVKYKVKKISEEKLTIEINLIN